MPSDLAYWLIAAPLKEGDPNVLLRDVKQALPNTAVGGWEVPELKVSGSSISVAPSSPILQRFSPFHTRPCPLHLFCSICGKPPPFVHLTNPDHQTGTLSGLLTLSDVLPKIDAQFTSTVSKCLDTLRSLTDAKQLGQHARINDRPLDEYIIPAPAPWRWDAGRWGSGGKVHDVVEALTAVCHGVFNPSQPSGYELDRCESTD